MEPIISAKGKSTQLRYELPQRVYDTKVYPVRAPNGSTIVLYGHDSGVGILWRGGRPLKTAAPPPKPPPKVNGTQDAVMILDSDDDEPAKAAPQPPTKAEFEDEEEELDPDQPYPSIIQQLRLPLNTGVFHVAVPQVPMASELRPADTIPPIFSTKIVFVVACADYSVRVITLPLNPPPHAAMERPSSAGSRYGEEIVKIPTHAGHQTIPAGVTVTWTSQGEPSHKQPSEDEMDVDGNGEGAAAPGRRSPRKKQARSRSATGGDGFDLLVASHSAELGGLLNIWRFGLAETSVKVTSPISSYQTLTLPNPATKIAFNTALYPIRRHSRLLVADSSGVARIYDPFASRKRHVNGASFESGAFVALFRTNFERAKANSHSPPVLATRKAVIDATWAGDGHHIVALLADGEWGVWDVDRTGPSPPPDPSAFSLRGFVGTSDGDRSAAGPSSPKARSRTSLAPMTPNTRKRKEETLFHGSSSISIPTRGGISVATLPSANGAAPEDSVVIWYGAEVHRIPDLAKFWSRTVSSSSGTSIPGPGLSPIPDVPLLGEAVTSIDQFGTTAKDARLAIPRDIIIATEHRLIITSNTNQPLGRDTNIAFTRDQAEEEETRRADQALLHHRELDLGGVGRLLEDMETSGSTSRSMVLNPRKVLFAPSAA
ncbi:hypothetical protein K458DRAFT_299612 [Lentithecium fluviatile CBS 122367]|uniref:Nucleoporin NUP37 n=1 Tax=Lentithecium fluviatile CBS 122367 TaxID=1168545 RepID=A0A6G1J6D8_9PLEO|nr:hypothetical protein K458DRAFT_299612 [Lentithecium fluviatile CBS 122367]